MSRRSERQVWTQGRHCNYPNQTKRTLRAEHLTGQSCFAPLLENGAKENKLQREDGVIKPPANIDPGMAEKPSDTRDRMPVIPPPGSPGGDPSLQMSVAREQGIGVT